MTDLTYRAARTEDPDQPLSHGHHAAWTGTTQQLANEVADSLRACRPDTDGALTVRVWPTREDEHYREPVPTDAAEYHYPARTGQEG